MKARVFDLVEMCSMGLSKQEILDIVGAAFEDEQKERQNREVKAAKERVANDTYTHDDLKILAHCIFLKERAESTATRSAEKLSAATRISNATARAINSYREPKIISTKEMEETLRSLGEGLFF